MSACEAAIQSERSSSPHRRLRDATSDAPPGVAIKGSTGVIWTTERAVAKGFEDNPEEWANLGQGAPEAGDNIPGARPRPKSVPITEVGREYASTAGLKKLRAAVANLYNVEYRQGLESQYTWENVCIVPGGRAGLIRIAAIISSSYLGFYIPDYTAYNEMLSLFKDFVPIPSPLDEVDGYHIHPDKVRDELRRGISVLLTSNPRNPTGELLMGEELADLQDLCRDKCTLIMDEFYSGYYYPEDEKDFGKTISSAANVIDVDRDDIFILDGLTKKFRLPGWRIAWILGPKTFINGLKSCGSYLDGGTNVPLQEAAIQLLDPAEVKIETIALQKHFKMKRDYVIGRLEEMGFQFQRIPKSTFYIWLDLTGLPQKISNGLAFLEACLDEKVIVVPGIFFDVNPSARRDLFESPCHHFVRLSYGPEMSVLEMGLDGIQRVIEKYTHPEPELEQDPLRDGSRTPGTMSRRHTVQLDGHLHI